MLCYFFPYIFVTPQLLTVSILRNSSLFQPKVSTYENILECFSITGYIFLHLHVTLYSVTLSKAKKNTYALVITHLFISFILSDQNTSDVIIMQLRAELVQ